MSKKTLTMGDLRARLYQAIDDVATGDLEPQRAMAIAKLAAQMNQSLMTEVEIAKMNILRTVDAAPVGELVIAHEVELIEAKNVR